MQQQRKEQDTREPKPRNKSNETREAIDDNETYPVQVFMQRVGLGKQAMASARRQGLPVIRIAGRAFVRGRDFSKFLGELNGDDE